MEKVEEPMCPCCKKVKASDRQKTRPHLCRWCGYNHDTGESSHLVPAGGLG